MLLNLKNVEYKYWGQKVLDKQNIKLFPGDHLLVLGPSGCGKTTLMNLMGGLLTPSSGEIIFENKNYSSLSSQEKDNLRLMNFGFIFQKIHLIGHLNVEQNIALARNNSNLPNFDELIFNLGLSRKRKQMASNLSVGEAQRVAIARGIVNNPKIIFADEPTSALDDINSKNVMDLIFLKTKEKNSTLIVSSHDNKMKKLFSNIIEISP